MVEDDFAVRLAGLKEKLHLVPPVTADLSMVCLDSFDWRLWKRGLYLTASDHNGSGLSLALRRLEGQLVWECRTSRIPDFVADIEAPSPAANLQDVLESRRLLPWCHIQGSSRTWSLTGAQGKVKCRLEQCSGTARSGIAAGTSGVFPNLLTVAELRGYRKAFDAVCDLLRDGLGLRPSSQPVVSHWFRTAGINPATAGGKFPEAEDPTAEAGSVVCAILAALWQTARSQEHGILGAIDTEFLHDYRVAVRRTRTLLGQFRTCFPSDRLEPLREELRWLGSISGAARDLDVHGEELARLRRQLPPDLKAGLVALQEWIEDRKRHAYRDLCEGLRSERYQRLCADWPRFLETCPVREAGRTPSREFVSERIRRLCRKALRLGRAIRPDTEDARFHELRIHCKKIRYLLEAFRGLYPVEPLKQLIRRLKELQDCLGRLNDCRVQRERLEAASSELPPAVEPGSDPRPLIGHLENVLEEMRGRERSRFPDCFAPFAEQIRKRRLRSILESGPEEATK